MRLYVYVYSGYCMCGHDHYRHHGMIVADPEHAKIQPRIPGACLGFGRNESEGCGPDGEEIHCMGYVDKDEPDADIRAQWKGTTA